MQSNSFCNRLALLLSSQELSQRHLADISGVTESAISHYLKGDRIPNVATLVAISEATGINPSWLLGYGKDDVPERM